MGNLHRRVEWSFCLTAAKLAAEPFARGARKAVLKFGGSAVAVIGEPGAWRPADHILEHAPQGVETTIRLGEPAARSSKTSA